ncbi:Probable metalloprotease ARX1 [Nakaseomyces glabratus]|nr:Metallopeptidase family M24 [Nakaseomyces glabratus]QNG16340.1 uncharacterized protein GWK60_L08921 [Nakaseomyces glabratus]SCV17039.1 Probable metalloprotease ARX1 [Nakaseomyces glabratus]SLM16837.1 Probable metalloprotease ARX1 [Nakaseomyces glabratus]
MDLAVSNEDSQILLKDKNVLQETVLDKYRTSGQITQTALKFVTDLINDVYHYKKVQTPLSISELCLMADSFIVNRLEQYYKHKVNERGIALPTMIDVDAVASGWCPEVDDTENIKKWNNNSDETSPFASSITGYLRHGDVVKISLGCHIDGYTSQVTHTMVIYPTDETNTKPTGPLLGSKADTVAASHIASESVTALLACSLTPEKLPQSLRNANTNSVTGHQIRSVVDTIAKAYNCAVVPGSRVRRIRRFLAGQNEGIVAEKDYKGVVWTEAHQEANLLANTEVQDIVVANNQNKLVASSAIPSDDFSVDVGEVYLIDLKFCPLTDCQKKGLITLETVDSYTGKSHKKNQLIARSGAYVRDYAQSYTLKLKTARQLLTKIDKNGVYPLKLSHLSTDFPLTEFTAEESDAVKKDLRSFRLGMNEITNNFLCVETPIQVAKWVPWDHILNSTNKNGALSYDASAALTLPGHEIPLPKLGISGIKLKSLMNSTNEVMTLPVARECSTVILCGSDVSVSGKPELFRLTGGSKTAQPSWVHSARELNPADPVVQGIFNLAELSKDKRFGLTMRETQPMKKNINLASDTTMEM